MNNTNLSELLAARHYGYQLFQRLLGDEPTREFLNVVDLGITRMSFEVIGVPSEKGDALCMLLSEATENLEALTSDYTRLFIGPASLPAAPWESVYQERQRTIMTKTTLDVRSAYRSQGFSPRLYQRIPDDHIALELDFLASLAAEAEAAHREGDSESCMSICKASACFIENHLGTWVDDFACDVREKGNSDFYAAVAEVLCIFVKQDESISAY